MKIPVGYDNVTYFNVMSSSPKMKFINIFPIENNNQVENGSFGNYPVRVHTASNFIEIDPKNILNKDFFSKIEPNDMLMIGDKIFVDSILYLWLLVKNDRQSTFFEIMSNIRSDFETDDSETITDTSSGGDDELMKTTDEILKTVQDVQNSLKSNKILKTLADIKSFMEMQHKKE